MAEEVDLEDYSDVMLIATILVGTSPSGRVDDVIRIHKMAFLMDKIIADEDLDEELDFGPDKFGPFSENLEDSLDILSSWGLFESSVHGKSKRTTLTDEGASLLKAIEQKYPGTVELGRKLNSDLGFLSTRELVKLVYRLYPSQTVNSLIKDDMVKTMRIDSFTIDDFSNGIHTVMSENGKILEVKVNGNNISVLGGDLFA
jgi:uncharacterized protein YwgA